jgi:hypothetical protein
LNLPNQPGEYVGEDGLADRYLIPARTAQRWRASGEGPPFVRLGRRRVLYRVADVEAWLAARTFKSRADELSYGQPRLACSTSNGSKAGARAVSTGARNGSRHGWPS